MGSTFANFLRLKGWKVSGTCTSSTKANELRKLDINAFVYDDEMMDTCKPEIIDAVLSSTHIISTIPPTRVFASAVPPYGGSLYDSSDAILHTFRQDILEASTKLDKNGAPLLEWIGYLSSTGVYGDRKGEWVSEKDPVEPDKPKSIARADAERSWKGLHEKNGIPVHIFRLAGIYGPGRSAVDTLRKANGDVWACGPDAEQYISRIHIQDICTVLQASILNPNPGSVYNVADDLPATRFDVLAYTRELMHYAETVRPSQVQLESVRGGSKRVDNSLMKQLLREAGLTLQFPDYRSGIKSIVQNQP